MRKNAWGLVGILGNVKSAYDRHPATDVDPKLLAVAESGRKFLNLARNGGHYAAWGYCRKKLMEDRKSVGGTKYEWHLAEYHSFL